MFEFEAKTIFSKLGIPTPRGEVASSPEEASRIASTLGGEVVVKSQVLAGGRGKAGGIKFAETPDDAKIIAEGLLERDLLGSKVTKVLVEEKIKASNEIYIGVTVDLSLRSYVLLASSQGGMNIEEILENNPEKLVKIPIDPLRGLMDFDARDVALRIGLTGKKILAVATVMTHLYRAVMEYDAELVEINPLIEDSEGSFLAADARMVIDDNSLYRHPEFGRLVAEERRDMSRGEAEASAVGFSYVELDGDIGVVGNGAGLVMATLDLIQFYGGKPANFLDIGGGASAEVMENAMTLILRKPNVKAIVVNVLGGITHCDDVAKGILEALERAPTKKPIVVRMVGTREEEGKRLLLNAGLRFAATMEEAIKESVRLSVIKLGES